MSSAVTLYEICRPAVQLICRTYWRASFEGLEHVPPTGPFVLAPVHRSFIDFAIVSGVTRRRLHFMAKAELWKYPLFRPIVDGLAAFPVRRGGADRDALRRCIAYIEQGEPVVLFPEGTRRYGPVVEDLYEGAAYVAIRTGVPIVPVGIGGSERALRKGSRLPRPATVHVIVGPPLLPPPTDEGRAPSRRAVRELTERLGVEVQALFDRAQRAAAGPKDESVPPAPDRAG